MNTSHVLNVKVSWLPQVADDKHPEFFWEVGHIWMILQVSIREDLEEFEIRSGNQSPVLLMILVRFAVWILGHQTGETIFVKNPKVDTAHSQVVRW